MALLSEEMDSDLLRLWGLVAELSEQLNNNRSITAALQAQAGQVKGQAVHTGTGFVLRRFNTDLSKEVFESELERMNAGLLLENQSLQHENKQLSSLLKEYEQTLETVMTKFRSQAHAAQQHELTLTRHYETLLLSRETSTLNADLTSSTHSAASLAHLSHLLRMAMRSLGGEDPEASSSSSEDDDEGDSDARPPGYREGGYSGSPPREDWALAREIEIVRLEKENEELRRMLGIAQEAESSSGTLGEGEQVKEWERAPRLELPTRRGSLSARRGSGLGRGRGARWVPPMGSGQPEGAGTGTSGGGVVPDPQARKSFFKEFPTL